LVGRFTICSFGFKSLNRSGASRIIFDTLALGFFTILFSIFTLLLQLLLLSSLEKISIKPKQIQLKTQEKDVLKVSESKLIKSHIRKKKISINRTESPTHKTNLDCKNSKIILSERLKRKPSLLEKRDRNNIPPKSLVTSEDLTN
jgi:hypothetical protein